MIDRFLRPVVLGTILVGSGCVQTGGGGDGGQEVTLKFAAAVGEETCRCGQVYEGLGTTGENAEVLDLRLYVSNIRLINDQGEDVPLSLDQDGKWQVEDVALLDFEDGTGKCGDTGNEDVRGEVTGTVPQGTYNAVIFELGVPFDQNHDDLTAAPAPLNVSALFWGWAVGHQFVRVDLETEAGLQWGLHLGSTGCESGGATEPPVSECSNPNRPQIALSSFDFEEETIEIDLKALFAASDLSQDTPNSGVGCESFPNDVDECTTLFPSVGLDFATGECIDECANQTICRVRNVDGSAAQSQAAIARGNSTFETTRVTVLGENYACINCHGNDAAGNIGPDIRPANAAHCQEHCRGDGPHPVKFANLTLADFDDIGAYLASLCAADPECVPDTTQGHH